MTPNPTNDDIREYVGSVSHKGTVTIPNEVRRRLKIKPKGKVIFRLAADTVEIKPIPMTLEDAMGSVPALTPAKSWQEISQMAKEERTDRYFAKMHQ